MSDGLANILKKLKKLYHFLFGPRITINIEYFGKNFKRVKEKLDPVPVDIKGFEVACEYGKVIDVGNSKGITLPSGWLESTIVKKQWLTDEKGEKGIWVTKPTEEEVPA